MFPGMFNWRNSRTLYPLFFKSLEFVNFFVYVVSQMIWSLFAHTRQRFVKILLCASCLLMEQFYSFWVYKHLALDSDRKGKSSWFSQRELAILQVYFCKKLKLAKLICFLSIVHFRENMPSHFKFKEYCPMVFRNLRERFGIDDQDFQVGLLCVGTSLSITCSSADCRHEKSWYGSFRITVLFKHLCFILR